MVYLVFKISQSNPISYLNAINKNISDVGHHWKTSYRVLQNSVVINEEEIREYRNPEGARQRIRCPAN